jgi:anaerobic magnesium-protoporphyrin IX monomethyl ester cyclase
VRDAPVVLTNCREAGINFHIFSMIGFPGESPESADKTFQFFVDHRAIIDHPGNSFDIHPFGLELRTRYFAEAASLGVVIRAESLRKDFLIGLPERSWTNTVGLQADDVARMLGDYVARLRRLYGRHHNCPGHLWPGFEEYALLYADAYAERTFPYQTALPEADDPRRYRLTRNPLTHVEIEGERVRMYGREERVETSLRNFQFMVDGDPEPFEQTARTLRAAVAAEDAPTVVATYRSYVHRVIGKGLLRVELSV